jgi:hypothetical protein
VEGFAIGLVEAHQDFVRFQHLNPHDFLGLVLGRQVGEAFRAWDRAVNDVEHLVEAHRLQQPGNVFVGGDDCRQQADLLPRQNGQLGQQAKGGAIDAAGFGQIDHDRREVQRCEDPLNRRIQRRTQGQAHFTDKFQCKASTAIVFTNSSLVKNEIIYFPKHNVITMIVAIKMTLYFAVV